MKKVLAIVALLAVGVGSAYAVNFTNPSASGTVPFGTDTNGMLDFKPSANVAMAYDSATATGVSYTVGAVHGQGSRVYGSSSVDTNIYYVDVAAPGISAAGATVTPGFPSGTSFPASLASGSTPSTYFGAGWTASK
ncbi:hypothetical protein [Geomonas subterranea]|uniref:Uncharacterized protein n=1 Tax=Geomonas subterranea TaxID=2847989 RepID=A0ABX8LJY5_9BACT|nr:MULTISPECIES: hypothetical protein [Geomonas]QXE92346.1 hypothetical protein KP001_07440 [Geomonas subterranea]QXM09555.1 hypothetical protein KP002_00050 [Geomonas subterranea]